jgi:hypothetical protein
MSGSYTTHRRITDRQAVGVEELRVSRYDNVSGMLLALLILVGLAVAFLFILWISSRVFARPEPVPVVLEDVGGGREDGVLGESMELDAPDAEEISREAELPEPQVEKTLSLVDDAIGALQADLDDPALTEEIESGGGGKSTGDGRRPGLGSGDGPAGIPRYNRWEIYFQEGSTLASYAEQLDHFGIELGVVGGGDQVHYARRLSQPAPEAHTGTSDAEKRLYMSWRQGGLKQADESLLQRAGIDAKGKIALQFYPADVENRLAQLEIAFAGRDPSQIRKTRFGVRGDSGRFEFYVIDQAAL